MQDLKWVAGVDLPEKVPLEERSEKGNAVHRVDVCDRVFQAARRDGEEGRWNSLGETIRSPVLNDLPWRCLSDVPEEMWRRRWMQVDFRKDV